MLGLDKIIYDQIIDPMQSHINVGFGSDFTIVELAKAVSEVVGYQGSINFDLSKPDGPTRKLMDSSKLNRLGWIPKIALSEGLKMTYINFLEL